MEPTTLLNKEQERSSRITKRDLIFSLAILVIIFVVSLLMPGGESDRDLLVWQDDCLRITCPDEKVYAIPYQQITGITLVEDPDFGICIDGDSTEKYRYGLWENQALGQYVLCTFKSFDTVIQVDTADRVYWIGYDSSESTRLLYQGFMDTLSK